MIKTLHASPVQSGRSPSARTLITTLMTGLLLLGLAGCGGGGGDGPLSLTLSSPAVVEGDSGTTVMAFSVTLNGTVNETITLNYATSDGSATAGVDYVADSGTLTIPAGSTSTSTGIEITINGDSDIEVDETLIVTIDGIQGATLTQASYTSQGTITTDDNADPAGYYTGTASVKMPDNSTELPIPDLQVLANGPRILAMGLSDDPDNFLLYDIIINNISGNTYTGDVTLYKTGAFLATTTVSGTITEGVSLEGSFAGAGIGNGSFTVNYDAVVNAKTAGLSEIANTSYLGSINASIGSDQRFDIFATGNVLTSFASTTAIKMTRCEYVTGSSLTAIAGQNLYDLVFVLDGCDDATVNGSYTGLATLIDDPVLPLANSFMPAAFSNGSFAGTAASFDIN